MLAVSVSLLSYSVVVLQRPSLSLPAAAGLITTITALRQSELEQAGVLVALWIILGVCLLTSQLSYILPAIAAIVVSYLGWDTLNLEDKAR